MLFPLVKDAIIAALIAGQGAEFVTTEFQKQGKGAKEIKDKSRIATVFYAGGQFGKAMRSTGPTNHETTFKIELTVAQEAEVDLAVLNSPTATPAQKVTALNGLENAAKLADDSIDELFEKVYEILMDGLNYDFGLNKGIISDRMVNNFGKDEPVPRGDLVVLTGSAILTLNIAEQVPGNNIDTSAFDKAIQTGILQPDEPLLGAVETSG